MNWSGQATSWLLLGALCLTLSWSLWRTMRRGHRFRDLLFAGSLLALSLPLLHAALVWSGCLEENYVRVRRQWLVWLPAAAALWAWYRSRLRCAATPASRELLGDCSMVLMLLSVGLAVAGLELGVPSDRLAVVVAIDKSRSTDLVPDVEERITRELQAAKTSMRPGDLLGTVVFGANAMVEVAVTPHGDVPPPAVASVIVDGTDIERALRRALAELPSNAAGKIVLLSDGVATRGDASAGAAAAVAAGVPVDVVPLDQQPFDNVRLVKLSAPTNVSQGETFELRVVVESPQATELKLSELLDGLLLRTSTVSVGPGQTLLNLRQVAETEGLHHLQVAIATHDRQLDRLPEDNQLARFVRVRGRSRVLLLSETEQSTLAGVLESAELHVDLARPREAPSSAAGLAGYDLCVIENAPASSFTPIQLDAIASFVRVAGGGLLLMGSPLTLGPGGYARTPIEQVSPVSFDLKQDRFKGQLSQVIIIDYSGSMGAHVAALTKLQLANEGAVRTLELLGPGDRLGVLHVDTQASWTIPLAPVQDRASAAERVRAVAPGGGGISLLPALHAAYDALRAETSALKHTLLFADGSDVQDSSGAMRLVRDAKRWGISTSVVALGRGEHLPLLERVSSEGAGRFYVVEDAGRLPAVFAQETVTASRAATSETPFRVSPRSGSPITRGISFERAPLLGGHVVTLTRPRASVLLTGPEDDPVLATWRTGLGRSATFTSDYGGVWGKDWSRWPSAAQLFVQLARSLVRSQDDAGVLLDTSISDGNLHVSADVLTEAGSLDATRSLEALIAAPDGSFETAPLRASGAGRYAGSHPLRKPGAYLVSVRDTETDQLLSSTGVELSTGDELKPTGSDLSTLTRIAADTGGSVRDTLAGLFQDRLPLRFAFWDATAALAWLAGALLLCSVAATRLRLPQRLTRTSYAPSTQPDASSSTRHPTTDPSGPASTAGAAVDSMARSVPRTSPTTAELLVEKRRRHPRHRATSTKRRD